MQSAEQGCQWAQYNLGISYRDGKGIEQNEEEAIKWFQKAVNKGYGDVISELIKINPTSFKLSDVIIYAIGGVENLKTGTKLDSTKSVIDILVHNREKVNAELLRKYGATNVWIETEYYIYNRIKEDVSAKELFNALGGFLKNSIKAALTDDPPDLPADPETEWVWEDLGEGCVHVTLPIISVDMAEDFEERIKPQCSQVSFKRSNRELEVSLEQSRKTMERFFGK